jgi:hypothetical protein
MQQADLAARGKYLVSTMGCGDCHSPKIMTAHGPEADPALVLSGHPSGDSIVKIDKSILSKYVLFNASSTTAIGPWGASYAANLTSDSTGIGTWTLEQFTKALKEGKSKGIDGNRMILPPMPWTNYANIEEEDLKAIFAFLKSTKPVRNIPPTPKSPDQL